MMGSRQYQPEYFRGGEKIFRHGRLYDNYFRSIVDPCIEETFEGLEIDPRTRAYRRRNNPDPKPAPRSIMDTGRLGSDNRDRSRGRYAEYDHRTVKKSSNISFGKAMPKLFKQLEKAETFYGKFQQDFDEDTANVKKYASERTMTDIWVQRLKGNRGRRGSDASQNDNGDGAFEDSPADNFVKMKKAVTKALETAVGSSVNDESQESRRSITRKEAAIRMQEKVETANEQILDLLELVVKDREHCEELLKEIKLLMDLIDPGNDANKGLYKGGGGDMGSSDEGGGGSGGGQDWN